MRFAVLVSAVLLFVPAASAQDAADPAAFLAEVRAKHHDLTRTGLESFSARIELRRSADAGLDRVKKDCGLGYVWSAPATEEIDDSETLPAVRAQLTATLKGLWRELTGALFFDLLEAAEGRTLAMEGDFATISGTTKELGEIRGTVEVRSGRLTEFEIVKAEVKVVWLYSDTAQGLEIWGRDVLSKGTRIARFRYEVRREVSGFSLPTVVRIETEKNQTEFTVSYLGVNGRPAKTAPLDDAVVKTKVSEFEKAWREWGPELKQAKIREIADLDHDLAVGAIAKLGLKDSSPEVRAVAAEALGVAGRGVSVAPLLNALRANEDEIVVYVRIINALGELGDPRAVDSLAKDWWNQKSGENALAATGAKIRALGKIRHASSVDALLSAFTVTSKERIGWVKPEIVNSLKMLTGEDFGGDEKAWSDWWKKNRSGFRF